MRRCVMFLLVLIVLLFGFNAFGQEVTVDTTFFTFDSTLAKFGQIAVLSDSIFVIFYIDDLADDPTVIAGKVVGSDSITWGAKATASTDISQKRIGIAATTDSTFIIGYMDASAFDRGELKEGIVNFSTLGITLGAETQFEASERTYDVRLDLMGSGATGDTVGVVYEKYINSSSDYKLYAFVAHSPKNSRAITAETGSKIEIYDDNPYSLNVKTLSSDRLAVSWYDRVEVLRRSGTTLSTGGTEYLNSTGNGIADMAVRDNSLLMVGASWSQFYVGTVTGTNRDSVVYSAVDNFITGSAQDASIASFPDSMVGIFYNSNLTDQGTITPYQYISGFTLQDSIVAVNSVVASTDIAYLGNRKFVGICMTGSNPWYGRAFLGSISPPPRTITDFTVSSASSNSFAWTADISLFGQTSFDSINVILDSDSTTLGTFGGTSGTVTGMSSGDYIVRAAGYAGGSIVAYSNPDTVWGYIAGTVTDSLTSNPVDSVLISLNPGGLTTYTNTSGEYLFSEVNPDSIYSITASNADYTSDSLLSITVHSMDSVQVNFSMYPDNGFLKGTITDSLTSAPVNSVLIKINPGGDSTFTDSTGYYEFLNIDSRSDYILTTSHGLYVPDTTSGFIITPNDTTYQNVILFPLPEVWVVDAPSYENTMTMTAQLFIDGVASTDTNDVVGVFVGEVCRGYANAVEFPLNSSYVFNLMIYGNTPGETLTFKAWDASAGSVVTIRESITFVINSNVGNGFDPFELNNDKELSMPMTSGWNWFSLNVTPDSSELNTVLESLAPADGNIIKSQNQFAIYYESEGWYGGLTNVNTYEMYMMKLSSTDTLVVSGTDVDPGSNHLNLNSGWNWISYLPQASMSVNSALDSISPATDDIVKSQSDFTVFYDTLGGTWLPDITMSPGNGYMIKLASADTLEYPNNPPMGKNGQSAISSEYITSNWDINPADFVNSMTMTADISFKSERPIDQGDQLAAFVGNECRGVAQAYLFPITDKYIFSLMIYSNGSGEKVTFRYFDESDGSVVDIYESVTFQPDANIGNGLTAYPLTSDVNETDETDLLPKTFKLHGNYPNPFNPVTTIKYQLPREAFVTIKIYSVTGALVKTLVSVSQPAGIYDVLWDGTSSYGIKVSSGMYIYQMKAGSYSSVRKMLYLK